jgi:hypothetical protein
MSQTVAGQFRQGENQGNDTRSHRRVNAKAQEVEKQYEQLDSQRAA